MTSTESENNRSDRDRHDVAQSSAGESSPLRPQYAKVTLTVTLYERDEAVRQSRSPNPPQCHGTHRGERPFNSTRRPPIRRAKSTRPTRSPCRRHPVFSGCESFSARTRTSRWHMRRVGCCRSGVQRRVEAAAELDEEEI